MNPRRRVLFWTLLNVFSAIAIGITVFETYVRSSASAQEVDASVPWRVCVRDVRGLLPDPLLAVASVERAIAELQAHPGWATTGRLSLPPRVSAACQDRPIVYADGVVVRRGPNFAILDLPFTEGVEYPGPLDLIIFVLPDEEIDYFFWTPTGSSLGRFRHVVQESVCWKHGSGSRSDLVCTETTAGFYSTAGEVLDSHVMASGLIALHGLRR